MQQDLFLLIKDLLNRHTCVVVPGLGGFVANEKPADVDTYANRFFPPSTELVFNAHLTHNDGLICQEWAQRFDVSMDEASRQVQVQVEQIKNEIDIVKSLMVPGFGIFGKTARGIYTFVSAPDCVPNTEAFGLGGFYFPELKETVTAKRKHNSFVKKVVYSTAATAAVALVAFMLVPVNMGDTVSQMASFNPLSTSEPAKVINTVTQPVEQPVQAQQNQTIETLQKTAESSAYYLVLTQYKDKAEADDFVATHQEGLRDTLKIMQVGECYLVTCASTQDLNLATRMLNNVQQNSSYKQSFVLFK